MSVHRMAYGGQMGTLRRCMSKAMTVFPTSTGPETCYACDLGIFVDLQTLQPHDSLAA